MKTEAIDFPTPAAGAVVEILDVEITKLEKRLAALKSNQWTRRNLIEGKLRDLRAAREALDAAEKTYLDRLVAKILRTSEVEA